MDFGRRAAATAGVDGGYRLLDPFTAQGDEIVLRDRNSSTGVDGGYRLLDPSTAQGQMTVDALRMELLKESFRQELIVAELAKQRELGPEVGRELRLENAGPLCDRTGLRLTTLPQQNTSPVRQDSQLQCILPSSELFLDQALTTRGQSLMHGRRLAKERIEEWYQPPWRRSEDKDDTSLISARWPKKTFSGVKRKRNAESSAPNEKGSCKQWTCALCHVREWTEGTTGLKKIATAEICRGMQNNIWNCSICQVKCSGELDLKNHLKGRRHQENVEQKEIEENGGFQEAESYEKKPQQLADKNKRPASRWNCNMCKVSCTSESDLDSHLKGRRHQRNVKAQLIENNTVLESVVGRKKQQLIGIC